MCMCRVLCERDDQILIRAAILARSPEEAGRATWIKPTYFREINCLIIIPGWLLGNQLKVTSELELVS